MLDIFGPFGRIQGLDVPININGADFTVVPTSESDLHSLLGPQIHGDQGVELAVYSHQLPVPGKRIFEMKYLGRFNIPQRFWGGIL